MKERPILFSGEMVRAILDGRKTQTRRVVKPQPAGARAVALPDGWGFDLVTDRKGQPQRYHETIRCPYGMPGDRLWVRETHAIVPRTAYAQSSGVAQVLRPDDDQDAAIFREGWERSTGGFRWRPSIHMPRWACRILLEITAVRVERLQEVSTNDVLAEGVRIPEDGEGNYLIDVSSKYSPVKFMEHVGDGPDTVLRSHFASLWESINGAGSWATNPWVWVVEFRRVPS